LRKERIKVGPLAESGVLSVECEDDKALVLILGYPRTWLRALADDLAPRLTRDARGPA
jgi:hypothetical protein